MFCQGSQFETHVSRPIHDKYYSSKARPTQWLKPGAEAELTGAAIHCMPN